jgi:ribonucleoside-diphosphate reductase alpha chain
MAVQRAEREHGTLRVEHDEYVDMSQAGLTLPTTIVKRDGRVVPFDIGRIENALVRCFASFNRSVRTPIPELAQHVVNIIAAKTTGSAPTVEGVQDIVEMVLQAAGEFEAAKRYILYRAEHAKKRKERPIPLAVRRAFAESDQYFPTPIQKFQFFDKYSRFNYELGRRETWIETVDRAVDFLHDLAGPRLGSETYERIRTAILEMRSMPSMRLLAMAGPAARRSNVTIYNCSYQPVESIDAFVEALTISMSGCGVGYSVERHYVENFPRIRRQTGVAPDTFIVEDSAEGWAAALRSGLETWFDGGDLRFDFSLLRPAGAPLRTKGGRASGPEPLRFMLDFVRTRILARQGSFLRPLDAHDMMCAVGNAAVSGGVRRTALISLLDYDEDEMRLCKNGDFERDNNQRWNANNSTVWPEGGLTQLDFTRQFLEMGESGRGEPGIFNRQAALAMRPERRAAAEFGTNPCGEIILRPWQFCNLTAAVARHEDTFESLREKVEVATIIGSIQSMATHFPHLRPQWKRNCEEERLLGVDITGQMDSPIAQDAEVKDRLRAIAIEVNRQTAQALGINQATAITCVKPGGNSSVLLDCSSGLHTRWSQYYVKNVRVAAHSPIFKVLRDAGVPMDPENGQTPENANTWVIHFPIKSPEGGITRHDRSAIQQCEFWLQNKLHWTEHNPSCFTGETRVVTDRGLMSFRQIEDYVGGDPTSDLYVLGKDGAWVKAAFQSLGEQEIWELVVERCGIRQTIRTTATHLWPITSPMRRFRGGTFELRATRELPIGSKDYKLLTVNPHERIELDLEGILHGITFGDGTRGSGSEGRKRPCSIALCNDPNGVDSRELASFFFEAGYSATIRDDRQQIQFYGLPEHWKMLPPLDESPEYLRGFIAGWFAADGHISNTITLSSVRRDALEWLQIAAPRAGLATPTMIGEHYSETGVSPVTWYTLALVKETLNEDFFLLNAKRAQFTTARFAKYWKIVSVRPTGKSEPVYCVEVQDAEPYFVLEGNILTHNCTITYRPDEMIDLMKWVWDHHDVIGGMAFLPAFDAHYAQMPYAEITKEEFERLAGEFPEIDFSKLYRYEETDLTTAAQELACSSGMCEIDF